MFYRHTITLEILSESPQLPEDLEGIAYEINEGEDVGGPLVVNTQEISAKEMAASLYRVGSEPSFFELDDNGNKTE